MSIETHLSELQRRHSALEAEIDDARSSVGRRSYTRRIEASQVASEGRDRPPPAGSFRPLERTYRVNCLVVELAARSLPWEPPGCFASGRFPINSLKKTHLGMGV